MGKVRCFGSGKPFYEIYHDHEWAVPSHDDRHLFEMLCLEGAQAGLSWEIILKRREGYREAFHQFDPIRVAAMTDKELELLHQNPKIIRNRLKIASARTNARSFLEIQREFGSFDRYVWAFVNNKPLTGNWKTFSDVPCQTQESQALSKDLQKRGMRFVGPTIIYSFMQAVGMVNDHTQECWCHAL
ncbi:MAG: DNA-3-methyladenine glycosylase I [Chlamydiia bacterium]|nr:DNA-3-methyladenine glycosylase I [Chlamydiia bacterium]